MFKESIHITNQTNTPAGRLCGKIQDYTATANTYAYSPSAKPHAVRRYYNGLTNELSNLRWDNNGNLAQQTVYSVNNNTTNYQTMRMLFWDEDDRLNLVAGDGYLSYYAYGHDGNRAIKMTGNAAIDQTGTLLNSTNLENITIYPNEYLTVTQAEYTKYYYAGGNRIASKIGTGGFEKMQRLCTEDLFFSGNANTLFGSVILQVTNTANQPNDEYPVNVCGGYNVATELLTNPLPDFYISQTNLNFTQNNLLQQFRQNLAGGTEPVYYFHSDHLGSASWITNGSGLPVQHLLYLPFGEHFANEHSSGYDERFTFTGKERDAETGYYYHGARFNCSDIGWLSVDPMADKYPSLTPYNYCAWNPIKLVDLSGMEFGDYYAQNFWGVWKKVGSDNINDGKIYLITRRSDKRKVKEGRFSEIEHKIELPSFKVRQEMCDYLETADNKDNLREYGGSIWESINTGEQEIRKAVPGRRWDGVSSDASIATNEYGNDGFNGSGKRVLTFFHSHFSGKINNIPLTQWPSGDDDGQVGDIQNVKKNGERYAGARLPYNIMVAMGSRKVFLYTEYGVQCIIKLDVFKTIGGGQ
ncbi:MAG: RHS repeat-associated core domain-containing protein [Bacteroidales bacterium]|nr:RHS repeat-associated core domain-containing protein [Bacteroidales bacterium]